MRALCLLLIIPLVALSLQAQEHMVYLDKVYGLYMGFDSTIRSDAPVTFWIGMANSAFTYNVVNGFRIWSPDGAEWGYPYVDSIIDTTVRLIDLGPPLILDTTIDTITQHVLVYPPFLDTAVEFNAFYVREYGLDGIGADTVSFAFVGNTPGGGIQPGYDGLAFEIPIRPRSVDVGRTICLDSSWFSPGGTWKWACTTPSLPDVIPDWDGPHCFTIGDGCCFGVSSGNVDDGPVDVVDIGDLTALIDYLFISQQEPACLEEANVDGDANGTVDIGDLTALIRYLFIDATDHLAPCR
ncbi:MAG TPA: hypothetical protein VMY05_04270 [Acidobacteriota bacterium]|nr:hypothetical protein [Acidobacteriota bacterium]